MRTFRAALAAVGVALLAAPAAKAIPTLQLGVSGGVYDSNTQTVMATSDQFTLYAYLIPSSGATLEDDYKLSIAIVPAVNAAQDLGSFVFEGETINVTGDMSYGTPPLEAILAQDPGDLPSHGIYPTYFAEFGFRFNAGDRTAAFNTADSPSATPDGGTGMYFHAFTIDTSLLAQGYAIHFDLYDTKLGRPLPDGTIDIDVNKFAPFSHDAQSLSLHTPPGAVPEPTHIVMMALGLAGALAGRRVRGA
jgi:hypothetical protein